MAKPYLQDVLNFGSYKTLAKSRYVNDKQITDHYAIIPTGSGLEQLDGMNDTAKRIYELVVRRFLSIFYPAAVYQKVSITTQIGKENFFSNFKILAEEGYLKVAGMAAAKKTTDNDEASDEDENDADNSMFEKIQKLKKELYTIIAEHSGNDYDKIYADSDRDYWMTAAEAKAYGLIDMVLEKRNKLLSFSNMLRYVLGGNPEAVHHFRCSELNISSPMQPITDVDGERGPDLPLHVTCEPGALKIVM